MAIRGRSPSADTSEDPVVKPKVLSSSPALSCISTVALSEVEVLEFSDDEECGTNDEPSDAFQWCLVGSRIAPVFADMIHENILEDAPVHEPQSEMTKPPFVNHDQDDANWRHVGLRLAAVMKEAAEQDDAEDAREELDVSCRSEPLHADAGADEHSWRLVGLRLAHLFSSLDCDGETVLPTIGANEVVTSGGVRKTPKESLLEAHERWNTVGSRLSAVLRTAEQ